MASELQDEDFLGPRLHVPVSAFLTSGLGERAAEVPWTKVHHSQPTSLAYAQQSGECHGTPESRPLRVYSRKGKSHMGNTYVADFTWFIRIPHTRKAYCHHCQHIVEIRFGDLPMQATFGVSFTDRCTGSARIPLRTAYCLSFTAESGSYSSLLRATYNSVTCLTQLSAF